jgi:2-phospho-L-lactate guanylyltransferase
MWTLLVPLRALPGAKSRLAQAVPRDLHGSLVAAIRADTLDAAGAADKVARIVIIGDAPGPDVTVVQTSPGLNGALRDGAAFAAAHWPDDGIAALVGDLPALRAAELGAALRAAGSHPRAFVPDASGTGTTLLTARPGVSFDPRFGVGSAARHAAIAVALLDVGAGLRTDVDTATDLADAARVGLGSHTGALVTQDGSASSSR